MLEHIHSSDSCNLCVDKQGLIKRLNVGNKHFAMNNMAGYPCVHVEYTKTTPGCYPFSLEDVHEFAIDQNNNTLNITKEMAYPKTVRSAAKILLDMEYVPVDEGIKITLSIKESADNLRYGISLPIGPEDLRFPDRCSAHDIVNFIRTWQRRWDSQDYIELPIVSVGKQLANVSVCCPVRYNSQFFKYIDRGFEWLKISTTTSDTRELEIHLLSHEDSPRQAYLRYYPDADSYVNFWKIQVRKIKDIHGTDVCHKKNRSRLKPSDILEFDAPDDYLLPEAVQTLESEVLRYKIKLDTLSISEFILAENIKLNGQKIIGFFVPGTILLDASIDQTTLSELIHHEIFHAIRSKLGKSHGYLQQWTETCTSSVDDFESSFSDYSEGPNKLFSLMMADPTLIAALAADEPGLQQKYDIIKAIYYEVCGKTLNDEMQIEYTPKAPCDPDANQILSEDRPQPKRLSFIVGVHNSGVPEISKALTEMGLSTINKIDELSYNPADHFAYCFELKSSSNFRRLYETLRCNVIWLVRNPQFIANAHYQSGAFDVAALFRIWVDVNNAIVEIVPSNELLMIKYEDLIVDAAGVLRNVCSFIGLTPSKNPTDTEILDAEEDDIIEHLPKLTALFREQRDSPAMLRTRYAEVS